MYKLPLRKSKHPNFECREKGRVADYIILPSTPFEDGVSTILVPIVGQCVLSKLLYVCLLLTATDSSTLSRLQKNQAVCNSVIVKNTLPRQVESPRFILHGNLSTLSSTLSYLAPSTTRLYAQIQVQLNNLFALPTCTPLIFYFQF